MKIEEAIQQKQFESSYQKAHINIIYTSSWLNTQFASTLKPHKISWQQFNILRILRGMHPNPSSVKLLTERMIDKMSNASRLVEKLRKKGLVERQPNADDRRQVDVVITEEGLKLLAIASEQTSQQLQSMYENLSEKEANLLSDLLDKIRS